MKTRNKKAILAIVSGNILELYDYAIFGLLIAFITNNYFFNQDVENKVLYSTALFFVTNAIRPIGGLIGSLWVRQIGREKLLIYSLMIMGLGSLVIGVLPGFNVFGYFSSLVIIITRLFQGLSLAGEFPSSVIMLSTLSEKHKKFITGLSFASGVFGMLMGSFIVFLTVKFCGEDDFGIWGWRIPFIVGSIICFLGIILRNKNMHPITLLENSKNYLPITKFKRQIFLSFILSGLTGAAFYTLFIYMPLTIKVLFNYSQANISFITTIAMLLYVVFFLIFSYISDYVRRDNFIVISCLIFGLMLHPCFWYLHHGTFFSVLISISLLAIGLSAIISPIPKILSELFKDEFMSHGIYIGYNFGLTIFSGLSPFILSLISKYKGSENAVETFYFVFIFLLFCSFKFNEHGVLK